MKKSIFLLKALQETNKDLIVLHSNIISELKRGNIRFKGVETIILNRINENKSVINKSTDLKSKKRTNGKRL